MLAAHGVARRAPGTLALVKVGPGLHELGEVLWRHWCLVLLDDVREVLEDDGDEEVEQENVAQQEVAHEEEDGQARVGAVAVVHDAVPALTRGAAEESEQRQPEGFKVGPLVDELVVGGSARAQLLGGAAHGVKELDAKDGVHHEQQQQQRANVDEGGGGEEERLEELGQLAEAPKHSQHAKDAEDAQNDRVEEEVLHDGHVQGQVHERDKDEGEVELVPALREVGAGAQGAHLEQSFEEEERGEAVVGPEERLGEARGLAEVH
mmetsp:Transcript_5827/g.17007  ORF Transcript_5827/g.17007 Transcript_5827/m.17007 type:complete len:264 (-) Transcript_5827:199-990(-)